MSQETKKPSKANSYDIVKRSGFLIPVTYLGANLSYTDILKSRLERIVDKKEDSLDEKSTTV